MDDPIDSLDPKDLANRAKALCAAEGFQLARIAPAVPAPSESRLDRWIEEGKLGDMLYLARHAAIRRDPTGLLPGARSILMVALAYPLERREPNEDRSSPRISSYATRPDYHQVLRDKLHRVGRGMQAYHSGLRYRVAVDSAPLYERDYARLAGLGWIGKNTLLLHPRLGSAFFLGAILFDQKLEPDQPWDTGHCGTCQRCLDACPTQAFDAPYELDPSRCLSYWTIEHRGPIPESIAERLEGWLFGCDDCQTVCPWNRKAQKAQDPPDLQLATDLEMTHLEIEQILRLDELELKRRFGHTPLLRARRAGLLRNALAVLMGTRMTESLRTKLLPIVTRLAHEEEKLVRDAARQVLHRWNQIGSSHSSQPTKSLETGPLSQVE